MTDNLLNNSTQSTIHGFGVPEGQNRMEEEMYFKVLVKNSPNFMKTINPQDQKCNKSKTG